MAFTLGELAERVGGRVEGDGERRIAAVRSLDDAGPEDLAPLTDARYKQRVGESAAGALLVAPALLPAVPADRPSLVAEQPGLALITILELLNPAPAPAPGSHPTAVIGDGCEIDPGAHLGPHAVVGDGSRLAAGVVLHAHAVVGRRCTVGAGSVLHPHSVLYDDTVLGERVIVHAGAVLGADGFGYQSDAHGHHKVPQVGWVEIGDEVEVGANSAVDRGTLGATRVGAGSKLDNLVQVGHNVQVGSRCLLCGQAGVAGSTRLGHGVVLGGQSGVIDHQELGDGVQVAAGSAVYQSTDSGDLAGVPAIEIGQWRRLRVLQGRLGDMARRLKELEKKVEEGERP